MKNERGIKMKKSKLEKEISEFILNLRAYKISKEGIRYCILLDHCLDEDMTLNEAQNYSRAIIEEYKDEKQRDFIYNMYKV